MSITRLQQARQMYAMGQKVGRIAFGGGGSYGPHGGYQGGSGAPGSAESSGSTGNSSNNGNDTRSNPHTDSGYSTTSTPTSTKTPTGPTNIHNDDPNAPEAYEIIGGKKFDVTPDTRDERERARVRQSILDAPIPNITDKGISFFKDGNLLNSFLPGDNPFKNKPKFNMGNLLFNAGMFVISPALFAKYQKGKRLYSGAKFATDILSKITNKNVSKPFEVVEGLTEKIGLKDKNVVESFKESLTNNLTSKNKTTKNNTTNNDGSGGDGDGIASLKNQAGSYDEYILLLQKLQSGNMSDAEKNRYNTLKSKLGI